ncbi:PEP/pyruvate-binding domain-containing protein [Paraliomyxa miuraensis]|uniref:PEP/pyruvate-binding domain-containing protein n=1 Tax=Paraliomyxa miuraensis TaxID=376150 RepID=UPI002250AE6F|nr:PEP/pyruvate-binding domain-containing protein [Paraliomyxa miuraensis]MCX4246019.1 PEP-utilizing enzyme [Paraliomyxa miuraensis]
MSSLVPLDRATDPACGGKARGLARLIAAGLRVPEGFVIVDARADALPPDLGQAYAALGAGKVAVRSSGAFEDGTVHSYAGVYESVLDVEGETALRAAVLRCLASVHDERVRAYAGGASDARMSVVVQRMVGARCAGVLFTLDPVRGDDSRWHIEAVEGLGEALVSGRKRPDRYVVDPNDGTVLERELVGDQPVLHDAELTAMVAQARVARAELGGEPLDMEWAIDHAEGLYWLQARPITESGPTPLDELDTALDVPTPGFTRYNVGEILPGAITPLTATTVVEMIDGGFSRVYERMGVFDEVDARGRCFVVVSGHLLMSMRAPYLFVAKVAGANKEDADRSLGGRVFDELEGYPTRSTWTRLRTAARAFPLLRRAKAEVTEVEAALPRFHAPLPDDTEALIARLHELVDYGVETCEAHMIASTWSGMLAGVLQRVLAGDESLPSDRGSSFAALLQGIGGVESADIGAAVETLVDALRESPEATARVRDPEGGADDPALLAWLEQPGSGLAGERWRAFIERHGHRCVGELELRERDWSQDPTPLLAVLRASLSSDGHRARPRPVDVDALAISRGARRGVRWLLPRVHDAIRQRERGKSLLVRVARLTKACCVRLGQRLIEQGGLPEADLVYFLTRDELVALARDPSTHGGAMARLATRRRHALGRQRALRMPMVSRTRPEPLPLPPIPAGMQQVRGTPVSGGVVEGLARVARTPADAGALRPGEILIVPFTDAGWTPYFSIAGGLATEIGGTLSHGAVVARELGLPAVVDLDRATERFATGQRVRLDAEAGVLQALEEPPSKPWS